MTTVLRDPLVARLRSRFDELVWPARAVQALDEAGVDADVYVGSWSHWVTEPDRPVATGGQD